MVWSKNRTANLKVIIIIIIIINTRAYIQELTLASANQMLNQKTCRRWVPTWYMASRQLPSVSGADSKLGFARPTFIQFYFLYLFRFLATKFETFTVLELSCIKSENNWPFQLKSCTLLVSYQFWF